MIWFLDCGPFKNPRKLRPDTLALVSMEGLGFGGSHTTEGAPAQRFLRFCCGGRGGSASGAAWGSSLRPGSSFFAGSPNSLHLAGAAFPCKSELSDINTLCKTIVARADAEIRSFRCL